MMSDVVHYLHSVLIFPETEEPCIWYFGKLHGVCCFCESVIIGNNDGHYNINII